MMPVEQRTPEAIAEELSRLVRELQKAGRNDLLLRSIGVPVLEELRMEAAKRRLSRLLITKDYRFILIDEQNKEVVNEKCSRIKSVFLNIMDPYRANYYIVSSHNTKHVAGSSRVWYERLKVITLPRELVIMDNMTSYK